MRDAWGEWKNPKQVHFQPLRDDGWATYCMKHQSKVAKIIGDRTFTVTQPLTREATWIYREVRRIIVNASLTDAL